MTSRSAGPAPAPSPRAQPQDTVRLRGPGDIVAALPALLGYHATDSIVLIVMGGPGSRVRLTMRVDLPSPTTPTAAAAVAALLEPGMSTAGGSHAVLVVLDGDQDGARIVLDAVAPGLERHGLELRDALVVADRRYRSLLCDDQSCCPATGSPVPGSSAAVAAAVASGRVIHGSRNDVRAEIAPPSGRDADRAERVLRLHSVAAPHGSLHVTPAAMDAELSSACTAAESHDVPCDQAVRLALLVGVGEMRDRAYLHLVQHGADRHRRLWASVCRQLPAAHTVVPHVLFALAAYLHGDGAVASVALEAAEEVDAAHPSVRLLSDVIAAGIPPSEVRAALARCMASPD